MKNDLDQILPTQEIGTFWWAFAARAGFAVLFSAVLFYVGGLFGSIFFDPVMFVVLGMLHGFYILGNGVLLGVAAGYAAQHQFGIWRLLLAECIFATSLGTYVGISLILSPHSLAWLAGVHALGVGCFLIALAFRLPKSMPYRGILAFAGLLSLCAGFAFLMNRYAETKTATQWLAAFELFYGAIMSSLALAVHRSQHPHTLVDGSRS